MTTVPSQGNIYWRTVKNELGISIYINKNITELNELTYAGGKFVCEKIEVPFQNTNN